MATNKTIRDWLRAQGEPVKDRGRISTDDKQRYYAANPEAGVRLLPGPDDDVDAWEDLGVVGPESDPGDFEYGPGPETPLEAPEAVSVDPEPAHAKREWRKGGGNRGGGHPKMKPTRVTAGVRGDINAKISFALEIPGRIWQARDPACGGTFVEQRPAISDALTEIVCQSPDLIAWFAGSGGQFMLWMNLAAACWPVATVIMAHHVYHTLEEAPADMQQPDYGQYAA